VEVLRTRLVEDIVNRRRRVVPDIIVEAPRRIRYLAAAPSSKVETPAVIPPFGEVLSHTVFVVEVHVAVPDADSVCE
jgi:hypothetical protein